MPKYNYTLPATDERGLIAERPQIPYVLPIFIFMTFMAPGAFGNLAGLDWHELWLRYLPGIYTAKTIAAALLLYVYWRYYTRIQWSHLTLGVVVGLFGLVQWVATEYASQAMGLTSAPASADIYNPIDRLPDPAWRYTFYILRTAGPTLVVPVMEELFWRDFLWRALIRGSRFQEVAVGTFSWVSLLVVSAIFGAEHHQWVAGVGYGLLMGGLLLRTKSLGACIVAHGVTNLTLGLYVICTADWQFW